MPGDAPSAAAANETIGVAAASVRLPGAVTVEEEEAVLTAVNDVRPPQPPPPLLASPKGLPPMSPMDMNPGIQLGSRRRGRPPLQPVSEPAVASMPRSSIFKSFRDGTGARELLAKTRAFAMISTQQQQIAGGTKAPSFCCATAVVPAKTMPVLAVLQRRSGRRCSRCRSTSSRGRPSSACRTST